MLHIERANVFAFTVAVSLFFSLSSSLLSFSQKISGEADAVFILKGKIKLDNGTAAEGVNIEVKKNGELITQLLSGKNGKFTFKMNVSVLNKNNEYLIYISKEGTVPKTLKVNTYISPEEYSTYISPSFYFDLSITLAQTSEKIIVLQKASGKIIWDYEQHGFAFDQTFAQTKEDDTERLLAEKKKREEEELQKKKDAEEARLKAQAEFERLADLKEKEDAERLIQKNLAAVRAEMLRKRMKDSLDSLAIANKGKAVVEVVKLVKPISADDVDENAFDGTGAYLINIAKRTLKAEQEKINKEKAANLSAKYETNNTLTSLLNMVDEHEKNEKSLVKNIKQ